MDWLVDFIDVVVSVRTVLATETHASGAAMLAPSKAPESMTS